MARGVGVLLGVIVILALFSGKVESARLSQDKLREIFGKKVRKQGPGMKGPSTTSSFEGRKAEQEGKREELKRQGYKFPKGMKASDVKNVQEKLLKNPKYIRLAKLAKAGMISQDDPEFREMLKDIGQVLPDEVLREEKKAQKEEL